MQYNLNWFSLLLFTVFSPLRFLRKYKHFMHSNTSEFGKQRIQYFYSIIIANHLACVPHIMIFRFFFSIFSIYFQFFLSVFFLPQKTLWYIYSHSSDMFTACVSANGQISHSLQRICLFTRIALDMCGSSSCLKSFVSRHSGVSHAHIRTCLICVCVFQCNNLPFCLIIRRLNEWIPEVWRFEWFAALRYTNKIFKCIFCISIKLKK